MDKSLADKINALPEAPGVYLMKDSAGRVVYVGKANNLRARVRSYFEGHADERAFVPLLSRVVGDVETVLTSNAKEALLLENELVRRHKPRFNARLRDGQNFIYLRIDTKQPYPRLEVVRKVQEDGARYFGPYPTASDLRETLRLMNRYFKLRTCSEHDRERHKETCLLCQIARFPTPNVYDIPAEEYRRHVRAAVLFLEGRRTELLDSLRERMEAASTSLRFEEAARLRDQIAAVERTLEPQKVAVTASIDQDVFAHHRANDTMLVYVLYVRQGRLIGGRSFSQDIRELPEVEILASFVSRYYAKGNLVPDEILLPSDIEGMEDLATVLSERQGRAVRILAPQRGYRSALVRMALQNAEEVCRQTSQRRENKLVVLERLKDALHLARTPRRMECFDVSHFQGANVVASQVAMTDGEPDRSSYRRVRIRSVRGQDDLASMYEVVSRRLKRGQVEGNLPDLLVVDGGKGQLAAALMALRDCGVTGVDVIALAKSRETRGLQGEEGPPGPERIFSARQQEHVVLPPDSPEMLLLDQLRDEAHRFAIRYQQRSMRRAALRSAIESVQGVGEQRRQLLLRHFGSLDRLAAASVDELAAVVGPILAKRIDAAFHTLLATPSKRLETHDVAAPIHPD